MKKQNKNLLKISILLTIIAGFIIGIISTSQLSKENYQLNYRNIPYLQIFLNSFSLNYWYFFLLWLMGIIPLGFIIAYFIIYFKSFMEGVTFGIIVKSSGLFGVATFVKFGFLELFLIFPLLFYVGYQSLKMSFKGKNMLNSNNNYFRVIIITTIFIIIYALLVCIKFNFVEVNNG